MDETRCLTVPCFFWSTLPCVQYAQTDFAVVVQIGIESDRLIACGSQVDLGRRVGIVGWKEHIKLEAAVFVGRVLGSCDHHFHDIEPLLVATSKHSAAIGNGQRV